MEYALRVFTFISKVVYSPIVLILVLMEYALRELTNNGFYCNWSCLNPCFNGICSASRYVNIGTLLVK